MNSITNDYLKKENMITEEHVEQALGCCFKCQNRLAKIDIRCMSISEHVITPNGGFQLDVFNVSSRNSYSSNTPKRVMFCFDCFEKMAGLDYMFSDWREHIRKMLSK